MIPSMPRVHDSTLQMPLLPHTTPTFPLVHDTTVEQSTVDSLPHESKSEKINSLFEQYNRVPNSVVLLEQGVDHPFHSPYGSSL